MPGSLRLVACLALDSYAQQSVALIEGSAHGVHVCPIVSGIHFRLLNGAALNMLYGSDDLHRMILGGIAGHVSAK